MSRRSKPSGSTAPAPAVMRYLRRNLPVVVSSRMRLATFSAACAKSSMRDQSYRGKNYRQTEKKRSSFQEDSQTTVYVFSRYCSWDETKRAINAMKSINYRRKGRVRQAGGRSYLRPWMVRAVVARWPGLG